MDLNGKHVGLAICGSYCAFGSLLNEVENILQTGAEMIPIMSEHARLLDTRFGKAEDFAAKIEKLTNRKIISSIQDAERIGPGSLTDIMLIAPCTGNTLAKLSHGITDTAALMAVKSHMRNNKPVCIAISTNDALGINLENIGRLMNMKHIFFVPFNQDNYSAKPKSMVAKPGLFVDTLRAALDGEQLQPIIG